MRFGALNETLGDRLTPPVPVRYLAPSISRLSADLSFQLQTKHGRASEVVQTVALT